MSAPLLVEGYASLFGLEDQVGDVVRAGAFASSLSRTPSVPMLIQHKQGAIAGTWSRIIEDGRGLYVRGLVTSTGAAKLVERGLNGLSIGFRPTHWKHRRTRGRDLVRVSLVEISLVADPMQPAARFSVTGQHARAA
ncbi:MAG: HK97 family phage prohead protease [Pseudomonadota bacterium]